MFCMHTITISGTHVLFRPGTRQEAVPGACAKPDRRRLYADHEAMIRWLMRRCLSYWRAQGRAVMKLGVMLEGQEGVTGDLWRQLRASVEALGFESLWRSDHFMSLEDSGRDAIETWIALTLTAVETTRLRFGPLVCPMTFRHPSLL